jgi:hypothetical protein
MSRNYIIGSMKEMDIMMEKISYTRPLSPNHWLSFIFTMTGTMAVLTNLASTSFTAIERL